MSLTQDIFNDMSKGVVIKMTELNNQVLLYQTEDGKTKFEVNLKEESVWLTQKQMAELFEKDRRTVTEHIRNIFKEEELIKDSVCRNFRHTAEDGKTYETQFYNLDVIISVGYRVKSKRGTQFRIWANSVLKDYILKGYAINESKLTKDKLIELTKVISIVEDSINNQAKNLDEAKGIIKVLSDYSYALTILDEYDHQSLKMRDTTKKESYILTYNEAMEVINSMKDEFTTSLFGNEKDDSFKGTLGAIYQTAFGEEVYPSIEEKAAHLLYFIVKNHSFSDGNKRIAATIFTHFMNQNGILYGEYGRKRIGNNALVAITLMIAESRPQEKDIVTKVVVNLINGDN